jgi:hypothetical protein
LTTLPGPHVAPGPARFAGLTRWERRGLGLLLTAVVVFGAVVEKRSAFLTRHMGDLGVFARAAWAVRAGEDIYAVADNRFHYHYPPLFAILLTPLADPPPGAPMAWTLPYPVSVGLWYAVSVLCLVVGVHWLASALEQTMADPAMRPRLGSRRWWALRTLPVLVCLPPLGHTLMRGQVNTLLLLLLCGMAAAMLRGRSWRAGLWLAGAICLKVIPAFLLLVPLWRRDGRCLAGCAVGLVVGLGVVPVAVFGPARTLSYYQEWTEVLVRPGLGAGTDQSRAQELTDVTATDSQSFQAIFHNTLYPDPYTRPRTAAAGIRWAHWLLGGLLTLATLWAARGRRGDGPATVITFGSLVVLMILLSPVCHLHYFCLAVPLVMGLIAADWERRETLALGMGLLLVLACEVVGNTLPHFPVMQRLRDDGLASCATLLLWLAGCVVVRKRGRLPQEVSPGQPAVSGAAA